MNILRTFILLIISCSFVSFAHADDKDRFREVTAKILKLEHNGAYPTALAEVTYEYGCAERFLRVEKNWISRADRPGAKKPTLEVRVVLKKNKYIRCFWQNPRQGTETFNINNMVPVNLVAIQPTKPPRPPMPPVPDNGIEITESISVVLLSSQYQEVMAELKDSLDRGYVKISSLDANRGSGRQTIVSIQVQKVVPIRYMRREVSELGTILFHLSSPPGHPSYMIGKVEFVAAD